MNNTEIVMVIVAAVVGFTLATAILFPLLKRKGVNTEQIIDTAQEGLAAADKIVDGVQAALPDIPGVALVDKIIGWAIKGVDAAEQMNKAAQIAPDQRKASAIQLVMDCLTAANVEVTPDVKKIIDGCVEAAVFALPKTTAA